MYPSSRMVHDTMTGHLRRYLRRRSVANVSIEEGRVAVRSIYEENKNFTQGWAISATTSRQRKGREAEREETHNATGSRCRNSH